MRLADVLGDDDSISLVDLLFFANYSDALSTASCDRLQDVHIFKIVDFSINTPSLVVLRHDVGGWANVESFTVKPSHSLDISPHVVLATYCPRSSKMVYMLVLAQIFKPALLE